MHKKGKRNILFRKKKTDFENYRSFSHVNDLADPISAYRKAQRDWQIQLQPTSTGLSQTFAGCSSYSMSQRELSLMTVIEPVPMQEETGADETFPGFVTYVTKYEPPRKMGN
jgi:hypothetical protein